MKEFNRRTTKNGYKELDRDTLLFFTIASLLLSVSGCTFIFSLFDIVFFEIGMLYVCSLVLGIAGVLWTAMVLKYITH